MGFERVKRFFERPGRAVRRTVQRALFEHVVRVPQTGEGRFRVERVEDGVTYQAYVGHEGHEAIEAWEAYQGSDKLGVFTFWDGEHNRGTFTREQPEPTA